jgi:hypothetical protein
VAIADERATKFKVDALRESGCEPIHAFGGDEAVLAFRRCPPGVTLHPVGPPVTHRWRRSSIAV